MKKKDLFHPRIFKEKEWAEGYYERNKINIENVGKRFVKILKTFGFESGTILDVGCGFASVLIEIAKTFPDAKLTGIDLGEPLLDIGKTLINNEGLEKQITLLKGDAHNLKYKDDTFDIVINTYLLHIVENPIVMLNEIKRVVKPDGKILITDLRRGFLAYFIKKFKTAYTLKEASEIIKNSNLKEGNLTYGSFWWDYIYH